MRQFVAVAKFRHARAALIGNQMLEIARMTRVGHIDDGRSIDFHRSRHRVEHGSVEMPGIGNHPTAGLRVHCGLIDRATL